MDRDEEMYVFQVSGEADRITMKAMQELENAGVSTYPAILSALSNCVCTPSESLPLEQQAQLHALMRMYLDERIETLNQQVSS